MPTASRGPRHLKFMYEMPRVSQGLRRLSATSLAHLLGVSVAAGIVASGVAPRGPVARTPVDGTRRVDRVLWGFLLAAQLGLAQADCVAGTYSADIGKGLMGCRACPPGTFRTGTGFTISGVTCQGSLETSFERGQDHNGKPSYFSISVNARFVFYDARYGKWIMSDRLDDDGARARNPSSNDDVPTTGWEEYCSVDDTDQWTTSNLQMTTSVESPCAGSLCAAGQFAPEGATSSAAATCTDCPPGTYSSPSGASTCSQNSYMHVRVHIR